MTANDELSQCWSVYYEILINGASLDIFGHDAVRNMHLAVGFSLGTQDVFASAVCEENGELYFTIGFNTRLMCTTKWSFDVLALGSHSRSVKRGA